MKKKGLIISTIAMVVVLAASLTTATYAWFSSSAQATVDNISIQTVASEGLQVGVATKTANPENGIGYVNGQLSWESGDFTGDENFGSLVDFSSITTNGDLGSLDTAVIKKTTANTVYKTVDQSEGALAYADAQTKYVIADNEMKLVSAVYTDAEYATAIVGGALNLYDLDATVIDGTFIRPITYTSAMEPIGFEVAEENGDYLGLPIAVRSTVDMDYIFCTITVAPDKKDMSSEEYMPGMAAAMRIILSDGTNELVLEPFKSVTTGASGLTGWEEGEKYSYSFVIAKGAIKALDIYQLKYTIYIDGEDSQCLSNTAGSGFTVDIDYSYHDSKSAGNVTVDEEKATYSGVEYLIIADITKTK